MIIFYENKKIRNKKGKTEINLMLKKRGKNTINSSLKKWWEKTFIVVMLNWPCVNVVNLNKRWQIYLLLNKQKYH